MSKTKDSPPPDPNIPKRFEGEPPGLLKNIIWFFRNPLFLTGLVVVYVIFRLTGHDILVPLLEKAGMKKAETSMTKTNTVVIPSVASLQLDDQKTLECIAYAKANQKPYWIESITEIVHLQFDKIKRTRTATFQVVYVLRLLRDVRRNDQSFKEWFNSSDQRAKLTRISGADEESVHGANGKFEVQITGKAGEVRTVVTGGRFVWPYDAEPRNGLGDKIRLGRNDDTWNYPNDVNDAIREFTMLLYSDGNEITPIGQAAKWLKDGKLDTVPHRFNQPDIPSGPALPSISARWENVLGEQEIGIHFSWPPL
jgi:hypothetical protein